MACHIRDLAWVLIGLALGSTLTLTLFFLADTGGLGLPDDTEMDHRVEPGDPEIGDASLEPLRMRTSMYVGVMTAQVFLHTRATACNNTWGRYVPKLEFFCHLDEDGKEAAKDLPLIHMEDVDDTIYPPQKKVFRMLQHMCSHHLTKYDWFIRADDDVYLKVDQLTKFLNTLDKTKKLYIGQAGFGRKEDIPKLGLQGHSFCMGGPAVIFSRPALQALCPRLEQCLQEVVSDQEDVEIGRCVIKHLGIECTLAWEFTELFYHAYSDHYEGKPFTDDLSRDQHYQEAVAMHYAKEPYVMNNLHFYHTLDKIQRQRQILDYISARKALLEKQTHERDLEWGGLLMGGPMASATHQVRFNKTHAAYGDCKQSLKGLEQQPWMQDAIKEALQFVASKPNTNVDMVSYEGTTSRCSPGGKDFTLDLAFRQPYSAEVKHRRLQVLQKQAPSGESGEFRPQTMRVITSRQSVVFIIPLLNGLQHSLALGDYLKHVKVAFTKSRSDCRSPPTVSIMFVTDGDGEESFRDALSPRDITPSGTCGVHVYTWRPLGLLNNTRVLVHQLLRNSVMAPDPADTVMCVGSGIPLVDKDFTRRAARQATASQQMFHAVSLAAAGTDTGCQGEQSPDSVKQRCPGPSASSLCVHAADALVLTKECLLHPHYCVTAAQHADPKLEVFTAVDPGLNTLPGSRLSR